MESRHPKGGMADDREDIRTLLGHLYTIAIKEWSVGLPSNPVMNIRRPAPGPERNQRMTPEEEARILSAVDAHSNPMLGWIVRIAL